MAFFFFFLPPARCLLPDLYHSRVFYRATPVLIPCQLLVQTPWETLMPPLPSPFPSFPKEKRRILIQEESMFGGPRGRC